MRHSTAVELRDVTKTFGKKRPVIALLPLTATVPSGGVVAIVGENGAGKSTLLRIIAGTLRADSGSVEVFGSRLPMQVEQVRIRLGVLPSGGGGLYDRLTAREYLRYIARLRGMAGSTTEHRILSLRDSLGFHSYLDRRCGTFSTGMRQRIALAAAVIHSPGLLILDEPMTGLDEGVRAEMVVMVRALAEEGTTLIVATHHPEAIAHFTTQTITLRRGAA